MQDECQHLILYKGTHPSFNKCWMCGDCGQLLPEVNLTEYAVVFAAFKNGFKIDHDVPISEVPEEGPKEGRSWFEDRYGEG